MTQQRPTGKQSVFLVVDTNTQTEDNICCEKKRGQLQEGILGILGILPLLPVTDSTLYGFVFNKTRVKVKAT